MARKLFVCCDGTWNTPRTETNIFQTIRVPRNHLKTPNEVGERGATICSVPRGTAQVRCSTIAASAPAVHAPRRRRAGIGLSESAAMRTLAENYTPGAEIYVFGFSRGAYTARSLCRFIKAAGLLERRAADVARASSYLHHRTARVLASPVAGPRPRAAGSSSRREMPSTSGEMSPDSLATGVKIRFIGVYDTVARSVSR